MLISDIPIIAYHKISNTKEFGVTTISPKRFEKQLSIINDAGYKTITFQDFYNSDKKLLPQKPIIISFDDTYQCIFDNAFPIMRKFNFKGVLFVVTDYIGKMNSWEAYKIQRQYPHADMEMIRSMFDYGFEIASHGKTHEYFPFLSPDKIRNELHDSKCFLEDAFQQEIFSFCYPYGRFSKNAVEQVSNIGYKYAAGNLHFNSHNYNNNFCLQRRSIYANDTNSTILNKIDYPRKQNFNFILELLIQKGAYAGIYKKRLLNNF